MVPDKGLRQGIRDHPVATFVVLGFLFSWLVWLPLLAAVQGWIVMSPWSTLHLLGGLGPGLAAVVVIALTEGHVGLRRIGRQLLAWRGRRRAWAFAILVPPVLLLVAAPLSSWIEGNGLRDLDWSDLAGQPNSHRSRLPSGGSSIWCSTELAKRWVGGGSCSRGWRDATRSSLPQDW